MIESSTAVRHLFQCPASRKPLEYDAIRNLMRTADGSHTYPILSDKPVLVDFEKSVLDRDWVMARALASPIKRETNGGLKSILRRVVSPPKKSTRENIDLLLKQLDHVASPRILIIGGGTIGQGVSALYDDDRAKIVAFDIYATSHVHFVGDAHAIPLQDALFDAVVIQAVLEHVLVPEQVVSEIYRVLKMDGVVYSETPFLQHVHEGAYDFIRYTESGHRYLFRSFTLISSGPSGGAATQMLWSIDYFFKSLFRSATVGKIAKLAFFWLAYLDRIIPTRFASDAASGTFFLGRKSNEQITPKQIVQFYRGAQ